MLSFFSRLTFYLGEGTLGGGNVKFALKRCPRLIYIYIYIERERERERERKTEFLGLMDLSSMKYFKT